jgi:hypothetical protein
MSQIAKSGFWRILLNRPVVNFIMALLGLTAAYYTTIGSIRVSLAEKAEYTVVDKVDKRLAELEILIREGMVTKDQFCEFRTGIEKRLNRIEYYLKENRGN